MTQKRTHDYRSERTSKSLNDKLVDILPAGIYKGFNVSKAGLLSPGVLLTADGVRIEETENTTLTIPPRVHSNYKRRDLVVCEYLYEASYPAPAATYRVVAGVEAANDPDWPAVPDNCLVLAYCLFDPPSTTEWTSVVWKYPTEKVINCRLGGTTGYMGMGAGKAIRIKTDPNTGKIYVWATSEDVEDTEIDWDDPVVTIGADGIEELNDLAGAGRTDETVKGIADLLVAVCGAGWTNQTIKGNADDIADLEEAFDLGHYPKGSVDHDVNNIEGQHKTIIQQTDYPEVGASKTQTRNIQRPQSVADSRHYEEWIDNASLNVWQAINATWNNNTSRWSRRDTSKPAYALKNGREKFYRAAGSDTWTDSQWLVDRFVYAWGANPELKSYGQNNPTLVYFTTEEMRRNPADPAYNNIVTQSLAIATFEEAFPNTFVINGEVGGGFDLLADNYIAVVGSTNNDRGYTVKNCGSSNGKTYIEVNEEIPSVVVSDGYIKTWAFVADCNMIVRMSTHVVADINTAENHYVPGHVAKLAMIVNGSLYKTLDRFTSAILESTTYTQSLKGGAFVSLSQGDVFQIVWSHSIAGQTEKLSSAAATDSYIFIEEV